MRHFLDDFITAGSPGSEECFTNLATLMSTCDQLGLPMAAEKREGPTSCLVFLGIELDTIWFELRLPSEKVSRFKSSLNKWLHLKTCRKRELQSLVGLLHDASIVVSPGHTFLCRLIDLINSAHHLPGNSFLRLNLAARSDILWWHTFMEDWNGLSMMQSRRRLDPDAILTSDASGSWGCGGTSIHIGCNTLGHPRQENTISQQKNFSQ